MKVLTRFVNSSVANIFTHLFLKRRNSYQTEQIVKVKYLLCRVRLKHRTLEAKLISLEACEVRG